MILKPFDFGVLIFTLCITGASFFFVYSGAGSQNIIRVKGEGVVWVYPPDAAETLYIEGPLGDTVIEIREGRARVLSSPCANQTCVAAGAVHSHGQWIACLPNRVLVSIESGGGSDVDASAW
jgi:hypothetical protein